MPPRFKHTGCTGCQFLGTLVSNAGMPHDLYVCTQGGTSPTVLLRFGNEPPEYLSGNGLAWLDTKHGPLRFTLDRPRGETPHA